MAQHCTSRAFPGSCPARVPTFPDAGLTSGTNTNFRIKRGTHFLKLTVKLRRTWATSNHARKRGVLRALGVGVHSSLQSEQLLLVPDCAQSRSLLLSETSVQYDRLPAELQQALLLLAVQIIYAAEDVRVDVICKPQISKKITSKWECGALVRRRALQTCNVLAIHDFWDIQPKGQ